MDETIKKILEIVTGIQEELHAFRNENKEDHRAIRSEIADIRRDLEYLQNKIENMSGYAKEIDLLLSRVSNIEKHLGIKV